MATRRESMLSALRTDNSPFSEQQIESLKECLGALDAAQSQWLSGYLAGRLAVSGPAAPAAQALPADRETLAILYGSETGNGEGIAQALASSAEASGLAVELHALDGFRPARLRKLNHAVFVMSTHGEGDPPDEALDLFEYLDSDRAPELPGLSYRVLALGDRSYSLFCEAGRRLDERLQALGANPFGPRVDCDVDFEANAETWRHEVIEHARDALDTPAAGPPQGSPQLSIVSNTPAWSRQEPFTAEVNRVQRITGLESSKDVYHLELSLEGSGLAYEPGDALGVWAPNDPELVDRILEAAGIAPASQISIMGQQLSIKLALTDHLELTRLTADTARAFTPHIEELDAAAQREFIEQRQLADLLEEFPVSLDAQALADLLRPLGPRSYSIASSRQMLDEEVHLTVATLYSNAIGVRRQGVASGYLNHRLGQGGQVRVFPEPNRRFRLPQDPATPLIMIAAGTGIAPYRAFLQHLEAAGASPESWLIFGNPHLRTDFLYQREWLRWREAGLLDRIDTAWSRDQEQKYYVQHAVLEEAERIENWLQRGAHIYVCGALGMGQAVQESLQLALAQQRGLDDTGAAAAVAELRREKRLHKDLY